MKKFLLVFLLLFSFATLLAVASPLSSRPLKYQDARNYCNDIGMHIATLNQLQTLCGKDGWSGSYWTLEGTIFNPTMCQEFQADKTYASYKVLCARN